MKRAFTLAEVLITLAIIGVVAAMTMPTLIKNHQKQVYATRLKKAVNVLENMRTKLMADEEVTNFNDTKLIREGYNMDCVALIGSSWDGPVAPDPDVCGEDGYANMSVVVPELTKNFNVVKTCIESECKVLYQPAHINGGKYVVSGSPVELRELDQIQPEESLVGIYTADGFIFYFFMEAYPRDPYLRVYIDVNGEKGPNQEGRDLFSYIISHNKSVLCGDFGSRMMTNGWKMDY